MVSRLPTWTWYPGKRIRAPSAAEGQEEDGEFQRFKSVRFHHEQMYPISKEEREEHELLGHGRGVDIVLQREVWDSRTDNWERIRWMRLCQKLCSIITS